MNNSGFYWDLQNQSDGQIAQATCEETVICPQRTYLKEELFNLRLYNAKSNNVLMFWKSLNAGKSRDPLCVIHKIFHPYEIFCLLHQGRSPASNVMSKAFLLDLFIITDVTRPCFKCDWDSTRGLAVWFYYNDYISL